MSYIVSRRTAEFGIRIALGASTRRIASGVLYQSVALTAVGVAVGIPVAMMACRALAGLLFGIAPNNAPTIAAGCVIVLGAAAGAALIPAARAARISPMTALRVD
jgi:ABC-type antimicrobial peptide transport system permease subunit